MSPGSAKAEGGVMIGWRWGGGRWSSLASLGFKPALGFPFPCFAAPGLLQRSGSRLDGNLDLALRAAGLTGSDLGADRKRGLEGQGSAGPWRAGVPSRGGRGGKGATATWERRGGRGSLLLVCVGSSE